MTSFSLMWFSGYPCASPDWISWGNMTKCDSPHWILWFVNNPNLYLSLEAAINPYTIKNYIIYLENDKQANKQPYKTKSVDILHLVSTLKCADNAYTAQQGLCSNCTYMVDNYVVSGNWVLWTV